MRITRTAAAAVLGCLVAAGGCCETCKWCRPKTEVRSDAPPPPVVTPTERTAPLTGSTLPARTTAPVTTGAYGGPGN